MTFFFMRHGEASWLAPTDAERPLTESGAQRLRKIFAANKARLADIDLILHSPYLRAVQTAQIASQILGVAQLVADERWTPDADPAKALESLEFFADSRVLVVTHNPLVGYLVGSFCEGVNGLPEPFGTGTIARVDADWPATGLGKLVWKV